MRLRMPSMSPQVKRFLDRGSFCLGTELCLATTGISFHLVPLERMCENFISGAFDGVAFTASDSSLALCRSASYLGAARRCRSSPAWH